jgi:glycosyltransferase involved in cell wall biosynthesis
MTMPALPTVAAFTDTYLPTVNGVTYTVRTWRDRWERRGGRMDVVYPGSPEYDPDPGEYPTRGFAFPFYDGFRVGLPGVPGPTEDADVVHAHTPFLLGLSGRRLAGRVDAPLVASYHTPTAEYADYLADGRFADAVERAALAYERWFLDDADAVVVPSDPAREHLRAVGVGAAVQVVPNGVDTEFFEPVPDERFRDRYGLDGTIVGYTGRHGFEKDLGTILEAVDGFDGLDGLDGSPTVVFGGDGPARETLERRAATVDADVRFLGFLDREELPAFYSALDAFLFPSPVETQGLVALEANACGTPVVGVDAGALADTVIEGVTGYRFERGDVEAFREAVRRTLRESSALGESCLERRESTSVEHAVDRLAEVYDGVL